MKRTVTYRNFKKLFSPSLTANGENEIIHIFNAPYRKGRYYKKNKISRNKKRGSVDWAYRRIKPINDDWQFLDRDL